MTTIVFAGPTIGAAEIVALLPCIVLPPARQGDLWRAMRAHRPLAVAIIDGVFLDEPAVWHREILHALHSGTHVWGAASMGALRAAELHPFGMRGVGRIFAAFRDGVWPGFDAPFEDDDEVAVLHAPVAAGGAALCDAMVDLRATLLAAQAAGVIDAAACAALAQAMKALHFSRRSFAALAAAGPPALRDWLPRNQVAQKHADARAMLVELAAFLATDPPPHRPDFVFEPALVWERFVASRDALTDDERSLLDRLGNNPLQFAQTRQAALARLARRGTVATAEAVRAALDRFRLRRGLLQQADIAAWLQHEKIHAAELVLMLQRQATLDAAPDPAGLEAAMLDVLRIEGWPGGEAG